MNDKQSSRAMPVLLLAALLALVVAVARFVGERNVWNEQWFACEAGSPFGPFDVVWLVPVFGLLFGRSLAHCGPRPRSSVASSVTVA